MLKKISQKPNLDWLLFSSVLAISLIGTMVIYSLSKDNPTLFIVHVTNLMVGLIVMIILSIINYQSWSSGSIYLYFIFLFSLTMVLIFGKETFGAKRWIDLGIWQFQPSEFSKFFLIATIALIAQKGREFNYEKLFKIIGYGFVPAVLVLAQPDLGTFSVFFIIVIMAIIFLKPNYKILFSIFLIGILLSSLVFINLKDYQKERLTSFLQSDNYNLEQSKIAIGSGGVIGKGLGKGSQSQLNFLPVAHADFVFAGIAESFGFIGDLLYIIIFSIMLFRIIRISYYARDSFGRFFSLSVFVIFLYQATINIGGNVGLLPITGISLPFTSYGGSSMLVMFAMVGVVQSIYSNSTRTS
ncbi:hypothetical protein COY43_02395 [Candidatus Berkelbacteria bacterium CG_4_10_14_0_8_um_filter_35_9_33_8]|uniref:Probable peptidoglycan glycosyltransferase FtsW n=1 Tax=Candidatus Berkelbacteria bacterium CG_4_10_14_0_2_um_filter_35_9_33_12 TaxID=1974499 RepID=A0A2M7W4J7_9BACT|nr:MAG: hypothetical protein COX10_01790 [Candidatus Berkelbacteria bacterium CG23_combo_of_CG06-09_8_20_14_all_33_15]PIS08152.1 MAG: hypothetical protein COT76_02945 [Candidatus Berkelbacteria bacterium CG10_big_fil_rev_8_21_14_0_10_33_10]PIZ28073.1 MAG: hypothetical protein COY43_02395 [Candidatus Berkelbacteria bacterium CG_4_10_14_0_8_um_filter_35_9_33_8]PJA20477.1 MAG: hypothetical protein COX60_01640 [Candidatus Berkelbacteria bacterium CG_4_10_14_0_2_um_filter_35_9_33_12]